MKKILIIGVVVLVLLGLGLLVVPLFFVNSLVKGGFEALGPKVAKVETRLEGVQLSLFSGEGQLKGVFVGNPAGYQSPAAVKVGEVSVALEPRSLFSDKVVVRKVNVAGPEFTFEGGLQGNNFKQIMDNVQAFTGSGSAGTKAGAESGGKKLQLDEFVLTGAKLTLTTGVPGAKSVEVVLPDIRFAGLGAGPDGVTSAELTERVLNEVLARAMPLVAANASKFAQGVLAEKAGAYLGKDGSNKVDALTKGVGDLLRKK